MQRIFNFFGNTIYLFIKWENLHKTLILSAQKFHNVNLILHIFVNNTVFTTVKSNYKIFSYKYHVSIIYESKYRNLIF